MAKKKFTVQVWEHYGEEIEFEGTEEELQEYLENHEVNLSSAALETNYEIVDEVEI